MGLPDAGQDVPSPDVTDPQVAVAALLRAHGFTPSEPEVARLAEQHGPSRASIDRLYAVPETRYACVPLTFDPDFGSR